MKYLESFWLCVGASLFRKSDTQLVGALFCLH